MPIKTPKFWYRKLDDKIPLIEILLSPVSALYSAGHRMNLAQQTEKQLPIPLICVGNIVAGGSGKTPTLMALQRLIVDNQLAENPFFLSRGYGGNETKPHRVNMVHDTSQRVGDEPLLLAQRGNAIVSLNRYDGVILGHELGADLILMDDGYQNASISKDISFLVIDGTLGFGNLKLLPAGPLREPIAEGLARADALILIGDDKRNVQATLPHGLPVFQAKRQSRFEGNKNQAYIAFAGLAQPEKFERTLNEEGLRVVSFHAFPDHHNYTEKQLNKLLDNAETKQAQLITTEKDFVRLSQNYREKIQTFPIEIVFDEPQAICAFLKQKLQKEHL